MNYTKSGIIKQKTKEEVDKILKNNPKELKNLEDFVPRVAKEVEIACKASGYYWKYAAIPTVAKLGNMNPLADEDNVLEVSKAINGDVKIPIGFNDRKLYTEILKKVFDYEKCKSKK